MEIEDNREKCVKCTIPEFDHQILLYTNLARSAAITR